MGWDIELPQAQYIGHATPPHELQRVVTEVYHTPVVAIDTETTGLISWKDIPLYWSLAWGNQRATLHADMLPYFSQCFSNPRITWVFANAKYDLHMLANLGHTIVGKCHDVQVMHALLFNDRPHKLKLIAKHLLGITWGDFQDQFGKIGPDQTPRQLIERAERENFQLLVEYAANDAVGTLRCYTILKDMLEKEKTFSLFQKEPPYIETMWDFFAKIESPFTRSLWRMERRGVLVDKGRFEAALPEAKKMISDIEREITRLVGGMLNPNSTPQISNYATSMGIKPIKYTKGGKTGIRKPSWGAPQLKHYREEVPVFDLILNHRMYSKLLGTYIIGLHKILDPYGRIHTNFNQDIVRCMPAGELVLTDRGYIPVEDVAIGHQVVAHTGVPRHVVGTSKHAPTEIYKVTLSNSSTLRTTANHEYLTKDGWRRADELRSGDVVVVQATNYIRGKSVKFSEATVASVVVQPPETTYGLTVEIDHSHITNGIVTHNTGRISSSGPALQTIPRPENDHWKLRNAFIAAKGYKIIAADFSQLEMRLLAAAAQEQSMVDIFLRDWDIHSGNAALMYDVSYDDVNGAKDLLKKIKKLDESCTAAAVESELPGVFSRAHASLVDISTYLEQCAKYRGDAKAIGFGGPSVQAEVKPTQNGEPYSQYGQGNPVLPTVKGSVSTWRARSLLNAWTLAA